MLSPNPTGTYFLITKNEVDAEEYSVDIKDVSGRVILQTDNYTFGKLIDIRNVAQGIYLVVISKPNEVMFTQKLVITK
ncbi:MAG: T9SS type A sorting domain-containing protein [Bacteroidetes bacterium]|nr:T9SS type A sorting domain-containing protein [Bacteroidota bacterium]MBP7400745.1 T9SS type A sorting domain-containing protein [Chitinophagales bacterium]MBK7108487.1 T9SS type A sorting domain-containing protein [Bacteroidota bacterium]MBK8681042.1 T9SS type A sorting domain-containing protein [Bacteroidota bacterium]MBP8918023.1 T9SS type A sorting domain-containing protein [Chitinophagales bacterium]